MTHTLYYTHGSGNDLKPALVARQTGQTLRMNRIDVLAINPRGQVPYLMTDDRIGLGESNAIAWFLAEGTSLMPSDPLVRAQAVQCWIERVQATPGWTGIGTLLPA